MRPRLVLPPNAMDLMSRQINGLVRDFPELGDGLRQCGVDPRESGGLALSDVLPEPEKLKQVVNQLEARLEWRLTASQRGAVVSPRSSADPKTP